MGKISLWELTGGGKDDLEIWDSRVLASQSALLVSKALGQASAASLDRSAQAALY